MPSGHSGCRSYRGAGFRDYAFRSTFESKPAWATIRRDVTEVRGSAAAGLLADRMRIGGIRCACRPNLPVPPPLN